MLPVIVMPYHDPGGQMRQHLEAILPDLKRMFRRAFVGVTPATIATQPAAVAWLAAEGFFDVIYRKLNTGVGEQFHALYAHAAVTCVPDEMLHLCFVDRVAFALETAHRSAFMADARAVCAEDTPLMFHRSEAAWRTHPQNYRDIEGMATRAGELLFGQTLDFAWCHLVIQAGLLREILPGVKNADISMLAEMTLLLRDKLASRAVDWLAWEDPFLLSCDATYLKTERENSPLETRKRLAYIVPTLQAIAGAIDAPESVSSVDYFQREVMTMANILAVAGPNSKYQQPGAKPAGFLEGLWHGIILPITFIIRLFNANVGIYEINNNGKWYDFGFFLGLSGSFGGGSRTVYVYR